MTIALSDLRHRLFSGLPLLRFITEQSHVQILERPVDMTWYYDGIVPISVVGFNPFGRTVFFGSNSFAKAMLAADKKSSSSKIDWYLYEILFLLHDYMHIWAVARMLDSLPHCSKPGVWEDTRSLSDLGFVLIISEAVATVAVDWWTLSRLDLTSVLQCKTAFRCLTTSFQRDDLLLARKIAGNFEVYTPRFFRWMAVGYLTGRFNGFDDVGQSSLEENAKWLVKEREYGIKQRDYARRWLTHLSNGKLELSSNSMFALDDFRISIIESLAGELWQLFAEGAPSELHIRGGRVELPVQSVSLNFEFTDLSHVFDALSSLDVSTLSVRQFSFLAAQWLSYSEKRQSPNVSADAFDRIVRQRNLFELRDLCCRRPPPSAKTSNSSPHLFLPN